MSEFKLECVLFDLDGTLVDTSADLIASLNRALVAHGFPEAEFETIKPYISHGALPMITRAVGIQDPELKSRVLEFMLNSYEQNIAEYSRLYQGMSQVLNDIEGKGLKWGVVTNKRQRFTQPLMAALDLTERAACVVSGDTTDFCKPHPAPMFAACEQASVKPEHCVFIGDAAHDIAAGKSANMKTLAAVYGFLCADDQPQAWGADELISEPAQLGAWIEAALCC